MANHSTLDIRHSSLLLVLGAFVLLASLAPLGATAQRATYALVNARIQTITNGIIEDGSLIIRADTIAALGSDVAVPPQARVIDCEGLTLYPGMIDSGSQVGLAEVGSLPETRDYNELGAYTPHLHALTAVNPNSVLIPVTRISGVTTVLSEPSGEYFPGQAALINLHGYTPQQMHVGDFEAVVLSFPSAAKRGWWDDRSLETIEEEAEEARDELDNFWERAVLYARIDSANAADPEANMQPEFVPSMRAMLPVVRGEKPLLVKVDWAKDIRDAIEWVEERGIGDDVIFSGLAEGWRVADELAQADIPALVGPVLALPPRRSDRYDKRYANPGLMADAGVQVAIRSGEVENTRNLPYHAGFAAAYGMGRMEALRAVTIAPARIFGVADRLGSLEVGKKANLFAADGDPFQTQTQIEHLFIEGYKIPVESRQTRLYDEFINREPGLVEHPAAQK